ncbi:ACT domain-containing protein [Coriobacteriia bacterium Es71-Z0120]|uniref:ACT domain-containing protein n=1 Tax=Parvivirga hydrogeniphila TaxID=2939460 RepID=UPI0022609402|nr:ACT domain-containing protein [Parvivirga hydrogeniphila]MCL4079651.1 ACT domain-containing protein [Parvivirga hydrogeniphila]
MGPTVKQISVFIENKSGRVSEVTGILGDAGVNIRGFSVSDTADYGILRLVVDRPEQAEQAIKAAGFTVRVDDVICIDVPDVPGGLAGILKVVSDAGVNIEYVYSLVATLVVINVADVNRALRLLEGRPVRLVSQEDIAALRPSVQG